MATMKWLTRLLHGRLHKGNREVCRMVAHQQPNNSPKRMSLNACQVGFSPCDSQSDSHSVNPPGSDAPH